MRRTQEEMVEPELWLSFQRLLFLDEETICLSKEMTLLKSLNHTVRATVKCET